MILSRDNLYHEGETLAAKFCLANGIEMPEIRCLEETDRYYHLGTCAFYRPTTIHLMVPKCATPGMGGRAWSWPGYAIDRTVYGVIQHELGHHVDHVKSGAGDNLFSKWIHGQSQEKPLTGYLGTDEETLTFFKEWFAENFRLFLTNSDFSKRLRPKFYAAMIASGIVPMVNDDYRMVLTGWNAMQRILDQADKKVAEVKSKHPQPSNEDTLL